MTSRLLLCLFLLPQLAFATRSVNEIIRSYRNAIEDCRDESGQQVNPHTEVQEDGGMVITSSCSRRDSNSVAGRGSTGEETVTLRIELSAEEVRRISLEDLQRRVREQEESERRRAEEVARRESERNSNGGSRSESERTSNGGSRSESESGSSGDIACRTPITIGSVNTEITVDNEGEVAWRGIRLNECGRTARIRRIKRKCRNGRSGTWRSKNIASRLFRDCSEYLATYDESSSRSSSSRTASRGRSNRDDDDDTASSRGRRRNGGRVSTSSRSRRRSGRISGDCDYGVTARRCVEDEDNDEYRSRRRGRVSAEFDIHNCANCQLNNAIGRGIMAGSIINGIGNLAGRVITPLAGMAAANRRSRAFENIANTNANARIALAQECRQMQETAITSGYSHIQNVLASNSAAVNDHQLVLSDDVVGSLLGGTDTINPPNCNGYQMGVGGSFAGGGGIALTGLGGGVLSNGFLSSGYSPAMMAGLTGPYGYINPHGMVNSGVLPGLTGNGLLMNQSTYPSNALLQLQLGGSLNTPGGYGMVPWGMGNNFLLGNNLYGNGYGGNINLGGNGMYGNGMYGNGMYGNGMYGNNNGYFQQLNNFQAQMQQQQLNNQMGMYMQQTHNAHAQQNLQNMWSTGYPSMNQSYLNMGNMYSAPGTAAISLQLGAGGAFPF